MSEKSHAANVASFHHRGHGMDEATKAAAWSLATVLLSKHILPVSIACGSFWTFSVAALIAAGHRPDRRSVFQSAAAVAEFSALKLIMKDIPVMNKITLPITTVSLALANSPQSAT